MNQNPQVAFRLFSLIKGRGSNAPGVLEKVWGLDDLYPGNTKEISQAEPRHLSLVGVTTEPEQESISSCEYMLRNNRILSKSIAHLSETYFASQEEGIAH